MMNIEKNGLAFKRVFKTEIPEVHLLPWDKLHETRKALTGGMEQILDHAETDKRDLNESEKLAWKVADGILDEINAEFSKRDRAGTKDPVEPRQIHLEPKTITADGQEIRKPFEGAGNAGVIKADYRSLFYPERSSIPSDNGGFKNFNEFCRSIQSGRFDPRLESRTMITNVGAAGGFTVPEQWASDIWAAPLEDSIVMSRATKYPITDGNTMHIPQWDNYDHTSGCFGGVTIEWLGEEQAGTPQDAKLILLSLTAEKAALYCTVSNELLQDGINFERQLGDAYKKAMNFGLDSYLLTGNGVAKPLGALNAASAITIGRNTASDIKYVDVCTMFARLHPACARNAVWVVSPSTLPKLTAMVDAGNHSVWVANASAGIPGYIFGCPVVLSEKVSQLGTEADIVLADFGQYGVVMRKELSLEKTNAAHWAEYETDFRLIVRLNGYPLWKSAITPANGGDTLSWCVILGD